MLTLTCAGSVGTFPVRGGFACLAGCSDDGGYWQLAPMLSFGLKVGSGAPAALGAALDEVSELADAFLSSWLVRTTVATIAATTTTAATDPPTMARVRRRRACWARRSSCRSNLRLADARRCSLLGTACPS